MGLFDTIKEKLGLGLGSSDEAHKPAQPTTNQPPSDTVVGSTQPTAANNATTTPGKTTSGTINAVDVPAKLDEMAAGHTEPLNWRTSIVDLLKLLGMDSSLQSRRELATDLGCPTELMADSAQMNLWLHRALMQQLAEHGGTVPPELLN